MSELDKGMLLQFLKEDLAVCSANNILPAEVEWIKSDYIDEVATVDSETYESLTSKLVNNSNSVNKNVFKEEISDKEFKELFRMSKFTVYELQQELSSFVKLEEKHLLLGLWVLGNTKSFAEFASVLNVDEEYLLAICERCYTGIIQLSKTYVMWPELCEIMSIEKGFETEYGFPGVLGVIGSLHIEVFMLISDPEAVKYYNKDTKNYTIVLQFVCDNNLLFRDIFAGYPGSNSIADILKASPLYKRLVNENSPLVKNQKHLLGGTEHPQMPTLLTPYYIPKYRSATASEAKFNNMHSSVMLTIEKTFRIVETRFPRMKSLDTVSPRFAALTAGAICTLHNFTRLRNDNFS